MTNVVGKWTAIIKDACWFSKSLDVFFVLGYDRPRYDNDLRALIAADVISLIRNKSG